MQAVSQHMTWADAVKTRRGQALLYVEMDEAQTSNFEMVADLFKKPHDFTPQPRYWLGFPQDETANNLADTNNTPSIFAVYNDDGSKIEQIGILDPNRYEEIDAALTTLGITISRVEGYHALYACVYSVNALVTNTPTGEDGHRTLVDNTQRQMDHYIRTHRPS